MPFFGSLALLSQAETNWERATEDALKVQSRAVCATVASHVWCVAARRSRGIERKQPRAHTRRSAGLIE